MKWLLMSHYEYLFCSKKRECWRQKTKCWFVFYEYTFDFVSMLEASDGRLTVQTYWLAIFVPQAQPLAALFGNT